MIVMLVALINRCRVDVKVGYVTKYVMRMSNVIDTVRHVDVFCPSELEHFGATFRRIVSRTDSVPSLAWLLCPSRWPTRSGWSDFPTGCDKTGRCPCRIVWRAPGDDPNCPWPRGAVRTAAVPVSRVGVRFEEMRERAPTIVFVLFQSTYFDCA